MENVVHIQIYKCM